MHEISIAQSIISLAEKAAASQNAVISGVDLEVGELSGIEVEALRFSFSIIKEQSALKDAELNVLITKGEAECEQCREVFPCPSYTSSCPNCHSYLKKITRGADMKVLSITLDD